MNKISQGLKESKETVNLQDSRYYLNRELSWLHFNDRVLHEASDPRTPLLERLKFAAIFSSNLDEFFMVRISGLMEQIEAGVYPQNPDGFSPKAQLKVLREHLLAKVEEQHHLFEAKLRPALAEAGIHLLNYPDLGTEQRIVVKNYFEDHVFPVLTPLSVDPAHPFPQMSNLSLNLAVVVEDPETGIERFARVKVPDSLPRFVTLSDANVGKDELRPTWAGLPLEQVIAQHLDRLFPGMLIKAHYLFRITRDADFPVKEDEADDLLAAIAEEVNKRRLDGFVCRLEIERSMNPDEREKLIKALEITEQAVYEIEGLLNLKDLFFFMGLPFPALMDPPWVPVVPGRFRQIRSAEAKDSAQNEFPGTIFEEIRKGDLLVHHPYESFVATVEEFIAQAAEDPQVMAIKLTLYRTSGNSPIVRSLISAAENGKQVVALVELKARFDEENNIAWAQKLEDAGVHVVYGMVGLKTHTKTTLVVREEGGRFRRYVHIGTGNYNSKTAKLYTDLGLLSCREELGADLSDLFNYLTGYSRHDSYRKLLVAPLTLRPGMQRLIEQEIEHARNGNGGQIIAKMNSLVDADMIKLLYKASQAGVRIDLIIRGICCLRPGIPGVSENIRVISVIGRYLEHARIFYFENHGDEKIYIGSADWMTRNLSRRVEAVVPIEDPDLKRELRMILDIQLQDNRHAWDMHPDGHYVQRLPSDGEEERASQNVLMVRALAHH